MFTGIFKVCTAPSLSSDYADEITLGDLGGAGDVYSQVDPYNGSAVIRVYGTLGGARKGQIWANNNFGNLVQFAPADNWIRPVELADAEDWWVRFANITGDTAQLGGNANETWVQLSANTYASLILNDPTGPSIQYSVFGQLELRTGSSGPAEYSTNFDMSAETDEKKAVGK